MKNKKLSEKYYDYYAVSANNSEDPMLTVLMGVEELEIYAGIQSLEGWINELQITRRKKDAENQKLREEIKSEVIVEGKESTYLRAIRRELNQSK